MPRGRRGSVAVEFAFTAPVFLVMLAGVIEWGWFLERQVALVQATRDGALAGSVVEDRDDATAVAIARTSQTLTLGGFNVDEAEISATLSSLSTGDVVTVSVDLTYHNMLKMLPTPDLLRAESTFRLVDQ